MTEHLNDLIDCLRTELKEYGEMLARLDEQQELIVRRAADDLLASVASVQTQADCLREVRQTRHASQQRLASFLNADDTDLTEIINRVPVHYRPLLQALTEENKQLLARVQQRARQNHLLLRHSLELMQSLIESLVPVNAGAAYDGVGRSMRRNYATCAVYEAVG